MISPVGRRDRITSFLSQVRHLQILFGTTCLSLSGPRINLLSLTKSERLEPLSKALSTLGYPCTSRCCLVFLFFFNLSFLLVGWLLPYTSGVYRSYHLTFLSVTQPPRSIFLNSIYFLGQCVRLTI